MHILSSILLAFSSSIDSLIIGIAYGVKQIRIKFIINLVISIIVTLTTFLAMCLGRLICDYIPADICNYIGSTLLIIVGLYMIWDYYKKDEPYFAHMVDCHLKFTKNPIKIIASYIIANKLTKFAKYAI